MSSIAALEPNPAGGRALTVRFYDDQSAYYEWLGSQARTPGLLPGGPRGLAVLKAPDVVALSSIRAVGENGYLIHAEEEAGTGFIKPLDLASLDLPVGSYRIFACLTDRKLPCGAVAEDPPPEDRNDSVRYRKYRRNKVVLAVNDDHLNHRDWIQVATVRRERQGGRLRTTLDEGFHPPISAMSAYQRSNPLSRMADLVLEELGQEEETDRIRLAKTELNILRNIADSASTELVFTQAQRCLGLLVGEGDVTRALRGKLLNYRFDRHTFGSFLDDLSQAIHETPGQLYPQVLTLGATGNGHSGEKISFMRVPGEFQEREPHWVWRPPRNGFALQDLAILFPNASPGELRPITYGIKAFDRAGDYKFARAASELSHPGVAMVLQNPGYPLDELFISVEAESDRLKLRSWLRDGHAVYYW